MTTKEKIEVMQAWVEGKTIEGRIYGVNVWTEIDDPSWNWHEWYYRIKPKPLTREEITAQWVKDNNVKVGNKVKINSRGGVYQIFEILPDKIIIDLGGYNDIFDVEELKKVTSKIIKFTFEDRELFRDKWVRSIGGQMEFLIIKLTNTGIYDEIRFWTFEQALEQLEFIDGKPFGKEVWE